MAGRGARKRRGIRRDTAFNRVRVFSKRNQVLCEKCGHSVHFEKMCYLQKPVLCGCNENAGVA